MKDFVTHTFLRLLKDKNDHTINYHYDGKWLVIDGSDGDSDFIRVNYCELEFLPDYIKFNNKTNVGLSNNELTSLPDHIEFNNGGHIYLYSNNLTSLPDNIQFNNGGDISLYRNPFESLPYNIDEWYDRLDPSAKMDIRNKFPDHWIFDKERFGL